MLILFWCHLIQIFIQLQTFPHLYHGYVDLKDVKPVQLPVMMVQRPHMYQRSRHQQQLLLHLTDLLHDTSPPLVILSLKQSARNLPVTAGCLLQDKQVGCHWSTGGYLHMSDSRRPVAIVTVLPDFFAKLNLTYWNNITVFFLVFLMCFTALIDF